MRTISPVAASLVAVTLLTGVSATRTFAQTATIDKLTYLTFSGPVQVPGATLPAGKYVFQLANPASPSVWQVFDASRKHLLVQFFFVPTRERTIPEVNKANGKPVVRFHETLQGVPPAVRILYYPTDLSGSEFMYPKEQAQRIAAAAHQPVLALDENAAPGSVAQAIRVDPPTSEAASK